MLIAPGSPVLDQLQIAYRRRAEARGVAGSKLAAPEQAREAESGAEVQPGIRQAVATAARWRAAIEDLGTAAPPGSRAALAATVARVEVEQLQAEIATDRHLAAVADVYSVAGQASVFFGPSVPPGGWESIPEERRAKWLIPYRVEDPAPVLVPVRRLIRGGVVTHGKVLNAPPWVPDALRAVVVYGDLRVLHAMYPAWGAPLGAELMTEWESLAGWNLAYLLAQVLRGEAVEEPRQGLGEETRRWYVDCLEAAQAYDLNLATDWRALADLFGSLGVAFTARVLATSFSAQTVEAGLRQIGGAQ